VIRATATENPRITAIQRGQQQQPDNRAGAVLRGKRSNHLRRDLAAVLLRRILEATTHIDLAEEALRRHGHERVARVSGDVPPLDVAPFRRLDQVGLVGVLDEVEGDLVLDGAHHRRRPGDPERHVARHQELQRTHQAQGENSDANDNDDDRDKPLPTHDQLDRL
jgi:hypothetical protein